MTDGSIVTEKLVNKLNFMGENKLVMATDFNYSIINCERAIEVLKSYKGKWIYVKSLLRYYNDTGKDSDRGCVYTKLEVTEVQNLSHGVFLLGKENDDRVFISKSDIVQIEECLKPNGINLKFIIKSDNAELIVYLAEDFIKNSRTNFNSEIELKLNNDENYIITEGKTDWKHLKRALINYKRYNDDSIFRLYEYEDIEMGSLELLNLCKQLSKLPRQNTIICIFDADEPKIMKEIQGKDEVYKKWGNNVYSFVIPVPKHREQTPKISIEHYYKDSEIKLEDENKRRLFMGNEFSEKSGVHKDYKLFCQKKNKCGKSSISIIDDFVFQLSNENTNIALSKNQFAENILNEIAPFNTVDCSSFKQIFDIVDSIFEKESLVSNKTYSDIINKWNKDMEENTQYVIIQDGNVLTMLVKTDKDMVKKFIGNPIAIAVIYEKSLNALLFHVVPQDGEGGNGIVVTVNLESKTWKDALYQISIGNGHIEFIVLENNGDLISPKEILKDEIGRSLLYRALTSAGI